MPIAGLVFAALLIRLVAMFTTPPAHGDAAGSYAYRAVLLLDGRWDGLWATAHPPGLSILLALLSLISGRLVSPWWMGQMLAIGCTAGLMLLADRLLAPRLRHQAIRLACAALLASNENLIRWQSSPLSEPVFLVACLLAVVLCDRDVIAPRRAFIVGLLLGAASTVRLEGAMTAAGLLAFTAWRTRSLRAALLFVFGWIVTAGWLFVHVHFLRELLVFHQQTSFSIPPAEGLIPQMTRMVEVVRNALTRWLPSVLLLPYWLLLAVGVWRASLDGSKVSNGRRLNALFVLSVAPVLALVALSEPHKRTGVVLLAPAMVWISIALDGIVTAHSEGGGRRRARLIAGLVVLACVVELGRAAVQWRSLVGEGSLVAETTAVMRRQSAPPGPVWAFGQEPSIYGLMGWPEPYDFWRREAVHRLVRDEPEARAFVDALRGRGYRYLAFSLPPGESPQVPQRAWLGPPPRRSVLAAMSAAPERYGLTSLSATAPVWLFRID